MRSVTAESAFRFRMLAERAARLRAQAELLRAQAESVVLQARALMAEAGYNADIDDPVTDDGVVIDGKPMGIGVVLRCGRPIEDKPDEPDAAP